MLINIAKVRQPPVASSGKILAKSNPNIGRFDVFGLLDINRPFVSGRVIFIEFTYVLQMWILFKFKWVIIGLWIIYEILVILLWTVAYLARVYSTWVPASTKHVVCDPECSILLFAMLVWRHTNLSILKNVRLSATWRKNSTQYCQRATMRRKLTKQRLKLVVNNLLFIKITENFNSREVRQSAALAACAALLVNVNTVAVITVWLSVNQV